VARTKRLTRQFNLVMSESTYNQIREAADRADTSIAHIVRRMIDIYLRNQEGPLPLCADGEPCVMPQMHPRVQRMASRGAAGGGPVVTREGM
jgi:hypothetical protein